VEDHDTQHHPVEDAECYVQKNEDRSCLVKRYINKHIGNCKVLLFFEQIVFFEIMCYYYYYYYYYRSISTAS